MLTKGKRCVDDRLMAFVSVTRLRIRSLRFMPPFVLRTLRTLRQVRHANGFRGGALLGDGGRTFWTMTVWREEPDMRRYMVGGAHLAAMPKLLDWCDEASVVHWTQGGEDLPSWSEADRRMRAEGRPSKVRRPGPHHSDLSFRDPRTVAAVPIRPAKRR